MLFFENVVLIVISLKRYFNFSTEKTTISQKFIPKKKNNNRTTKTNFPEFFTSICQRGGTRLRRHRVYSGMSGLGLS